MNDIIPEQNMWFPGPDSLYKGREGDYARSAIEFSSPELVALVRKRVEEDGEWVIENGLTDGKEELMRKMMEWVSKRPNIIQCFNSQAEHNATVDDLCRELAVAAKTIAEGVRG